MKRHPTRPVWMPEPIAILPFNNLTNDLDGPVLIRHMLHKRLSMTTSQQDIKNIDKKLQAQGITDGGQLAAFEPGAIAGFVGAKGLIYGEVQEFNDLNLGFIHNRTVKVKFWFIDAQTGGKIWENQSKAKNSKIATSKKKAKENLVEGYARKVIEMIANNPLRYEVEEVVEKSAYSLERKFGRARFGKSRLRAHKRKKRSRNKTKKKDPGIFDKKVKKWLKIKGDK